MIEKTVPLKDINLHSKDFDRYLISFKPDTSRMTTSIRILGIVHPVILVETDGLKIISGLKRILAAAELGIKDIPARIYAEEEKSDEKFIKIAIYDNLAARELTYLEKALALSKLHKLCNVPPEELMEEFAGPFDIPPIWEKFLDYIGVAGLELPIRKALADGGLEFQACVELARLDSSDRQVLFDMILSRAKMNLNESIAFINDIRELCLILGKNLSEICSLPAIDRILSDEKINLRGKGTAIRDCIHKLRYRELSAREEAFAKVLKNMALAEGIRIGYPRFFEGDLLSIDIKARKIEELAGQLESLSDARNLKSIEYLLNVIQAPTNG